MLDAKFPSDDSGHWTHRTRYNYGAAVTSRDVWRVVLAAAVRRPSWWERAWHFMSGLIAPRGEAK